MTKLETRPFAIRVADDDIHDLRTRLARTRWPDQYEGTTWDLGTDRAYLQQLTAYWANGFSWRAREAELNRFPQWVASIAGLDIHFIFARSGAPKAFPLILTHGWPGSFVEMTKIIPMLIDPARFGHDPADAFDVVVPSLPGFGFSSRPAQPGVTPRVIADIWSQLMTGLGFDRFGVQGGDFGASISVWLARNYPDHVAGFHLNMLPGALRPDPASLIKQPLIESEHKLLADLAQFAEAEGGYAHIQRTKPQTLGYGLHDSPAGLAAWIVEKFRTWSDCGGDLETVFSRDELLTNLSVYWFTGTITSSVRLYREALRTPLVLPDGERIKPPFGFASFPRELVSPPREWAARWFDVARWSDMPRGGHFAAMEQPALLAEEIRAFFRPLR